MESKLYNLALIWDAFYRRVGSVLVRRRSLWSCFLCFQSSTVICPSTHAISHVQPVVFFLKGLDPMCAATLSSFSDR